MKSTQERYEEVTAYTDYIRLAACVMVSKGYGEASRLAASKGWTRVVETLQKATVAGSTAGSSGMALTTLLSAFMSTLRNVGAFDTIAQSAMKLPDRFVGRIGVFSSIAASSIGEGAAKTLKYLSLTMADFTPVKAMAQVVLTDECIAALSDEGVRILGQELKASVAAGSDAALLTALSGNSSEAMGQDTYAGICDDIEELLRTLNISASSRVFLILAPGDAKSLAVRAMANGVPTLSYAGGNFAGVEILVSDAQTPHRITAVDATGLVAVVGDLELRSSGQALVEMVDSSSQTSGPSVSAVNMVSMWQTNSKCLLAERSLAVKPIRVASYANLTGIALGQGSDSPLQG